MTRKEKFETVLKQLDDTFTTFEFNNKFRTMAVANGWSTSIDQVNAFLVANCENVTGKPYNKTWNKKQPLKLAGRMIDAPEQLEIPELTVVERAKKVVDVIMRGDHKYWQQLYEIGMLDAIAMGKLQTAILFFDNSLAMTNFMEQQIETLNDYISKVDKIDTEKTVVDS